MVNDNETVTEIKEEIKQSKVIMYSKDYCFYCTKAKNLLNKKNVIFEEINISNDYDLQDYVMEASGRMTVPQIFIDDVPFGGFDDIYYLEKQGELDKFLFKTA